jgi:hypothetical protein
VDKWINPLLLEMSVGTGEIRKIVNLGEDGEAEQYIEGTLGIGRVEFNPDHEYRIDGTMTSEEENYLVALHGER